MRGCIGIFCPDPLSQQLRKYTYLSAFKDSQFPPIQIKVLGQFDVGVSLLVNFQKDKNGIKNKQGSKELQLISKRRKEVLNHNQFIQSFLDCGAIFLLEVAAKEVWNINTNLQHLIAKAGYRKNYQTYLIRLK
ncbi:unnamed protein product [Paramecium octaurelia]|uniref:AMMECR1 domain-containing protein n=1 Tax=Paramecium octaurelia TaxID=43137 RepID=A0A8S1U332_PAROT|nr:unnamed protein product [Paramecium octaurelia]